MFWLFHSSFLYCHVYINISLKWFSNWIELIWNKMNDERDKRKERKKEKKRKKRKKVE